MADPPQKRRGRPPRGQPKRPAIALQLPDGHFDYLLYLVEVRRHLGATVNDAARYILIRELDKMMRAHYHEKGTPPE